MPVLCCNAQGVVHVEDGPDALKRGELKRCLPRASEYALIGTRTYLRSEYLLVYIWAMTFVATLIGS